jgi:CheY-like chemotaxis protein/anti-sigma regulatory factor (Ser/Thr protein kinase)
VIEHAVEGVRAMCDIEGMRLSVTPPKQQVLIDADALRFAQVLSNLLNNACRFTDRGGEISVSAERDGNDAVVRVRDTGVGIAREELPRIFDMFAQAKGSHDRRGGGLGIGLSLAQSIVALHGGSIEARSEGAGRGSEFIVRVPALSCERQPPSVPVPGAGVFAPAERSGGRARILAVDDNRDALEAVATLLRMAGHTVASAVNGEEAIEKARTQRPQVVLLDIGLPGMDGNEVARRIRSEPWGGDVLLIAMTGWGRETDKRRAQEAGFDAHLTKPIDAQELERLVAARVAAATMAAAQGA